MVLGGERMNLQYLFEIQAGLDAHIEEEHPRQEGEDRLAKKILALQVELGELANEWRGFKFWSNDQEPRVKRLCNMCDGLGARKGLDANWEVYQEACEYCEGTGKSGNPFLEEYVDCLHFVLSIGLELKITDIEGLEPFKAKSGLIQQFNVMFKHISGLTMHLEAYKQKGYEKYYHIFNLFIGLGEMLGFTEQQIEQAYLEKNKINHQRQESGY